MYPYLGHFGRSHPQHDRVSAQAGAAEVCQIWQPLGGQSPEQF